MTDAVTLHFTGLFRGFHLGMARAKAVKFAVLCRECEPQLANVALRDILANPGYAKIWQDAVASKKREVIQSIAEREDILQAHRLGATVPGYMQAEMDRILDLDEGGFFSDRSPDPRSASLLDLFARCEAEGDQLPEDIASEKTIGRMWLFAMLHETGPERRPAKVAA